MDVGDSECVIFISYPPTHLQLHLSLGPSEDDQAITAALDKIGKLKNVSLSQIALAYVMAKQPCIFPIVGIRKVEHLRNNIDALKVRLSKKNSKKLKKHMISKSAFS